MNGNLGHGPHEKGYQPSGVSKAEERASKLYPYESGVKGLICENSRQLFIQGYEYAEKDLALTWRDIKDIVSIADDLNPSHGHDIEHLLSEFQTEEGFYKEVLKRFNKKRDGRQ